MVHKNPTPTPTRPPDVQITTIRYDPPGSDVDGEYVRIRNRGDSLADMERWTLRDKANHTYTFPAFILYAGASVRVWTKSGTNTATDLYWGAGRAIWNDDEDTAYLRNAQGQLVDTYHYRHVDDGPTPTLTPKPGPP
jgi:hypothetical protein